MLGCAIYCRISDDRREGAGLGVGRQERECRELAERIGWTVGEVYVDNDVSAYSGKPRPAYRRMLSDLRQGLRYGIIVWHVDRLTRRAVELEELISALGDQPVHTVSAGRYDLSTPTGRAVARTVGAWAQHESELKGARQRSKLSEMARAGRPAIGGYRPFGYEEDRVTIRESEAVHIREAVALILAGGAMHALAIQWSRDGVKTTTGREWSHPVLRRMLMSARLAGWRVYHGELVSEGWPGIITLDEHKRVAALLGNPARRTAAHAVGRTYLLTGLLHCGWCDSLLIGSVQGQAKTPGYICKTTVRVPRIGPDGRQLTDRFGKPAMCGGGSLRIACAGLDEFIVEAVLSRLDGPVLAAALAAEDGSDALLLEAQRTVAALTSALDSLANERDDGLIEQAEYRRRRTRVEDRLTVARAESSALSRGTILSAEAHGNAREHWEEYSLPRKRSVLGAVLARVTIGPGTPGRKSFDVGRILDPVWLA
jgi:site-specific DNA recombinase